MTAALGDISDLTSCIKKTASVFFSVYTGEDVGQQPSGFLRWIMELVLLCDGTTALMEIPELTAEHVCMA